MEELILVPIPIPALLEHIQQIVRAEIKNFREEIDSEKLLATPEACNLFQPPICTATLKNWTRDGKVTKHHIGGRVFYKKSEILQAAITLKKCRR